MVEVDIHPTIIGYLATGTSTCTGTRKIWLPLCRYVVTFVTFMGTHSSWKENSKIFLNMSHILHQLLLRTDIIYSCLSYFEVRVSLLIHVVTLFWICNITKHNLTISYHYHVYRMKCVLVWRHYQYIMTLLLYISKLRRIMTLWWIYSFMPSPNNKISLPNEMKKEVVKIINFITYHVII